MGLVVNVSSSLGERRGGKGVKLLQKLWCYFNHCVVISVAYEKFLMTRVTITVDFSVHANACLKCACVLRMAV